ncbi:uncharacterized protein EDB91DRAFT_387363 [Suillus paluster]|uniref:uncharacterized protein n=1 Tax=Suillus paluster TaxID=48578 RepID=UPI001B868D6B|nr:uncharacterized protein EDB91DRAFT_387363 [Suillus paluster]KAG1739474.1 hypothetical protein EDB91DRAFT_387363 [Suillus paluster]
MFMLVIHLYREPVQCHRDSAQSLTPSNIHICGFVFAVFTVSFNRSRCIVLSYRGLFLFCIFWRTIFNLTLLYINRCCTAHWRISFRLCLWFQHTRFLSLSTHLLHSVEAQYQDHPNAPPAHDRRCIPIS